MENNLQIYPVKFSKVRRYLKKQKCTLVSKNTTTESWSNGKIKVTFKIQNPLSRPAVKMEFDKLSISIESFELFVPNIAY